MKEQFTLAQALITVEQQRFLEQQQLSLENFLRGSMRGIWQDRERAYQSIFQDWNTRFGQKIFTRTWNMLHDEEKEKLLITYVLRWSILQNEKEEIEQYPTAFYSTYYQNFCWLVCRDENEEAEQFRPLYELNDIQIVLDLFDQVTINITRDNEIDPAMGYTVILFREGKSAMAQAHLISEAVVIAALRFEQIISDAGIVLVD